jgi:hypothetical protein
MGKETKITCDSCGTDVWGQWRDEEKNEGENEPNVKTHDTCGTCRHEMYDIHGHTVGCLTQPDKNKHVDCHANSKPDWCSGWEPKVNEGEA